jgi:8-oxo-dGTP pyrophosphatase MutT (NUDIX family)
MTDVQPSEFGDELRAHLTTNLAGHQRAGIDEHDGRRAAVAVVVVDSDAALDEVDEGDEPRSALLDAIPGAGDFPLTGSVAGTSGGPAILLTRRAPKLRAHAGQWALPGGRVDDGETAFQAVCRELHEELGLQLGQADLLGELDDYATRSGYVIAPFVFWGGARPDITANPAEVRSVHRIAFRELCRADSPRFVTIPESDRPVVQLPIGGDLIHAPTAAVLLQFRRVAIEGVTERVSGYEQPVFAWR